MQEQNLRKQKNFGANKPLCYLNQSVPKHSHDRDDEMGSITGYCEKAISRRNRCFTSYKMYKDASEDIKDASQSADIKRRLRELDIFTDGQTGI